MGVAWTTTGRQLLRRVVGVGKDATRMSEPLRGSAAMAGLLINARTHA
jgi:hypothetical protein